MTVRSFEPIYSGDGGPEEQKHVLSTAQILGNLKGSLGHSQIVLEFQHPIRTWSLL